MRRPPFGSRSILSSGRPLMSTTTCGRSTFTFIMSTRFVPPARKRIVAPPCAVGDFAASSIACEEFCALIYRNASIKSTPKIAFRNLVLRIFLRPHPRFDVVILNVVKDPRISSLLFFLLLLVSLLLSLGLAQGLRLSPHLLNGRDNVRIRAAPANIAIHALLHVVICRPAWLFQQRNRRHDLPRRAVAALIPIVFDERRLHRMHMIRLAQSFDRCDLVVRVHHRERQARVYPPTVDVHRTGPALTVIATLLRPSQLQVLAKAVQERHTRLNHHAIGLPVHIQRNGLRTWHSSNTSLSRGSRLCCCKKRSSRSRNTRRAQMRKKRSAADAAKERLLLLGNAARIGRWHFLVIGFVGVVCHSNLSEGKWSDLYSRPAPQFSASCPGPVRLQATGFFAFDAKTWSEVSTPRLHPRKTFLRPAPQASSS